MALVKQFVKEVFEEFERISNNYEEPEGLAQVCLLLARWSVEERRDE